MPAMMAPKEDQHQQQQLRALAARAVTDSLRAAASRCSAADRAARFRDCVRCLEAEKAKMEVFRRELPISVHLVADVIDWLKEELALAPHRRPADLFAKPPEPAPAPTPPAPPPPAKEGDVDAEDANDDKRSWMSSAQLWSCGGSHDDSTANTNDTAAAAAAHNKVSSAFMPTTLASLPTSARSPDGAAGKHGAVDLSLSSPASAAAAPTPSATSSAVTDAAGAQRQHQQSQAQAQQQQQQRKARRCWSPELHRRFVAALQRLGGAQVATPKQIRELMKVDGLTNDEVKSHLQKYRLHTRRAPSDGGGEQHVLGAAAGGLWPSAAQEQQYATSQHSTSQSQSQSGSPQGPLQLATVSSRAMSATAGDSCDGGDEAEGGSRSESYGWEMMQQQHGTKASSSS